MPAQSGNNLSISQIRDGLINPNFTTPLYVSANSFTVAGDVTSWLRPGRGVVLTFQTAGIKRCIIVSLSYDSGTNKTTINVTGDSLTNETITEALISFSDLEATKNYVDTVHSSRVRATRGTTQTIPNDTLTTIIYDTEEYDGLGEYNPTTGKFTAKNSGWYSVKVASLFSLEVWTAGQRLDISLYKNGAIYSNLGYHPIEATVTAYEKVEGSDDIYLAAGDYIDIRILHDRGADTNIYASSVFNFFAVHRFA